MYIVQYSESICIISSHALFIAHEKKEYHSLYISWEQYASGKNVHTVLAYGVKNVTIIIQKRKLHDKFVVSAQGKISDGRRTPKQAQISIDSLPRRCEIDTFQYLREKLCNTASLGQIFLDISGKVINFFAHNFLGLCVQEHPRRKNLNQENKFLKPESRLALPFLKIPSEAVFALQRNACKQAQYRAVGQDTSGKLEDSPQ